MPSIRKRLKKLTSSMKSKSTSDLDGATRPDIVVDDEESQQAGELSHDDENDDASSQISEAVSERTDITTDSSYSQVSGEKKKKRRLLTFPRRKKKEKSRNVVFRSLSIEHDPRGNIVQTSDHSESVVGTSELVKYRLSESSEHEIKENLEVDSWRMSGLLENVDRNSQSSLSSGKDNLILTFQQRNKQSLNAQPVHSTPLKDEAENTAENLDEKDSQSKVTNPVIQVSFATEDDKNGDQSGCLVQLTDAASSTMVGEEKKQEDVEEGTQNGALANEDAPSHFKPAEEHIVEEDVIQETRQTDPESRIELNNSSEVESEPLVSGDCSFVCDIGRGKKVIIRHLAEVITNGNLEMPDKVSADDWLVLNMLKDDWVMVGYSRTGSEITELFDKSVDAIY